MSGLSMSTERPSGQFQMRDWSLEEDEEEEIDGFDETNHELPSFVSAVANEGGQNKPTALPSSPPSSGANDRNSPPSSAAGGNRRNTTQSQGNYGSGRPSYSPCQDNEGKAGKKDV
jgi:hypothetical protein